MYIRIIMCKPHSAAVTDCFISTQISFLVCLMHSNLYKHSNLCMHSNLYKHSNLCMHSNLYKHSNLCIHSNLYKHSNLCMHSNLTPLWLGASWTAS